MGTNSPNRSGVNEAAREKTYSEAIRAPASLALPRMRAFLPQIAQITHLSASRLSSARARVPEIVDQDDMEDRLKVHRIR